jgi:hypothetical protein
MAQNEMKALRRLPLAWCAQLPAGCVVAMEACSNAHHLARRLRTMGLDARLIAASFVSPYRMECPSGKNDMTDAAAICEAASRPTRERLGLGFVADRFDVVPVGANDESCIVVRVIVRAQTRRTIVFATRFQSCAIEGLDLLAILGHERQVKMRRLLLGLIQAQ